MSEAVMHARSNPFSTRFVRPGALAFHFAGDQSAERLVRDLQSAGWWGAIIGPHGSGKSTLLATLAEPLASAGRRVWTICLRDAERRLPADWTAAAHRAGANLVVIDGYEQLRTWRRWLIKRACRRRGWGLLVTAHRSVGLTTIFRTAPNLELAEALVKELLPESSGILDREAIARHFEASRGDVRETLFALYDAYEQAIRAENP
jgi:energy-coupling factor transporter ATP-binding protein EcfA2